MHGWTINPFLEINRRGADETIVYEPVFDNYYQFADADLELLAGFGQPGSTSSPDDVHRVRQLAEEHLILPGQPATPELSSALFEEALAISNRLGAPFKAQVASAVAGPGAKGGKLEKIGQLPFSQQLLYLAGLRVELAGKSRSRFNLFTFYIPLANPERVFDRGSRFVEIFWHKRFARTLLALNLLALALYVVHFRALLDSFLSYYQQRSLGQVLLILALFVLQASLHELGHGFALARYGQAPREVGIVFMFLFPGLYIDTSAAYLVSDKRKRIVVSAAGIIVNDLFILLGLLIFFVVPGGPLRDLTGAFVIGNTVLALTAYAPFIKTDTYFILSDLVDVPNLRQESVRVLKGLLVRKEVAHERKYLLAVYAALSLAFYGFMSIMSVLTLVIRVSAISSRVLGAIL